MTPTTCPKCGLPAVETLDVNDAPNPFGRAPMPVIESLCLECGWSERHEHEDKSDPFRDEE